MCRPASAHRHCAADRQCACLATGAAPPVGGRIPLRTLALGSMVVWLPLPAVHRPLRHRASGGGQPGQLPVAVVHRGAGSVLLPGVALRQPHVLAAVLGLAAQPLPSRGALAQRLLAWGYLPALAAAFIWASYSLLTRRVAGLPRRHRAVRSGVGPAVARCAMCCWSLRSRCRHATGCCRGPGPLGARSSCGTALQAGRCTAHRHPQLRHAAGLHQRCWWW